ncbi:MAG: LysM peptidoglycan-binding domain-containing protein, partial [Spirochaetes bacterium]|nr:LysM peptidoglycan-binding domain-containing protein [Spirochaetota bacterium]
MIAGFLRKNSINVNGSIIGAKDPQNIAQSIINEMQPHALSDSLIMAAKNMDMKFSIDKINNLNNNSISCEFVSKMDYYIEEMEKIGKLQYMEEMKKQLAEIERDLSGNLASMEYGAYEGLTQSFSEKGFNISGAVYKRKVIEDSTLVGGDDYKIQEIKGYIGWNQHHIPYSFITPKETEFLSMESIQAICDKTIEYMNVTYEDKSVHLESHIGESPTFNDDGDVTYAGTGESGRLINLLVKAEREKAEGQAKADQSWYEKGLFPGFNLSLTAVAKIGLSFIPGGQLAALAVSVGETAYKYATKAVTGLGGLLNVATSAIGAGASWLGNITGKALESIKTVGNMIGTVAKNVVSAAGSFLSKGFKVKSDGSMDWYMSEKEANMNLTSAGWDIAGGMAGDFTGDLIGKASFNIGNKSISYGKLASSFVRESIDFLHSGQFDFSVISLGALRDGLSSDTTGHDPSTANVFGEPGKIGTMFLQNMYNSDEDISKARNFGFGFSVNSKGNWDTTTSVAGGFDMSDITVAGIMNPAAVGKALLNVGKGIIAGIGAIGTAAYNLVQNSLFDTEQNSQPYQPFKTDAADKTPAISKTEEKKKTQEQMEKLQKAKKDLKKLLKDKNIDRQEAEEMMAELAEAEQKGDYNKFAKAMTKVVEFLTGATDLEGAQDTEYKVRKGDSLWKISQETGISVEELKKINKLEGENPIIKSGQTIKLNADGNENIFKTIGNAIYEGVKAVGEFQWNVKSAVNKFVKGLFESSNNTDINPSIAEIDSELNILSEKYNVPLNALQALVSSESDYRQYNKNGKILRPYNEKGELLSSAVGLSQILEPTAKLYDFDYNKLQTSWEYNLQSGVKVFSDNYNHKWNKNINNEKIRAARAYSIYHDGFQANISYKTSNNLCGSKYENWYIKNYLKRK